MPHRGVRSQDLTDPLPHLLGKAILPPPVERDDFFSNRHPAVVYRWSMIFSKNRYPLFEIVLYGDRPDHRS
jgi:hypothetical protein